MPDEKCLLLETPINYNILGEDTSLLKKDVYLFFSKMPASIIQNVMWFGGICI